MGAINFTITNVFIVLEAKTSSTEVEMEELKRVRTNSLGVAFSLGLTNAGRLGPFNTDITLKFGKVFSNFGNSYNVNTGTFFFSYTQREASQVTVISPSEYFYSTK